MRHKLKRNIGLSEATLYGVGIILGAGIYALIGEGAGIAGSSLWLSFVFAGIIAAFTGLSYAELSSMFPKEGAEYVYTKRAFNMKALSFVVNWVLIISIAVSAAAVALGFAGYFSFTFGGSRLLIAALLIAATACINLVGMKESARINIVSTLIEVAGLIIIISAGLFFASSSGTGSSTGGMEAALSATALIFFAYIGFEAVANISEETKNSRKVIPKALILSLCISTLLYILVVVSALAIVPPEALAASGAPLTEVAVAAFGPGASLLMSVIALFATANTVLVMLLVASRMIYGVSREGSLPRNLSRISRRGTPDAAILVVSVASVFALLLGDIKTIALPTTIGIFITYFFVNLSVIWLRYKRPKRRLFKSPVNIGRFPVLAFLGAVSCAAMLFYFEPLIIALQAVIIIIGLLVYKAFNR